MQLSDLVRVSDHEWLIPQGFRADMRVPVRLFATRHILDQILNDRSLEQAVNASTLPGIVGSVIVMPDMHQGYGFPIGGVAATRYPQGSISPGAIGYDINCGVRLLASTIEWAQSQDQIGALADRLQALCPSGVGKAGPLSISEAQLENVLLEGSRWALRQGFATQSDLDCTEDGGRLEGADPGVVSDRARSRGRPQLGSLGAGNHFIEVDVIERVFDEPKASSFGLEQGCLALQIHCGSRGLGHQVCADFVQQYQSAVRKYEIQIPDRELVCAPIESPEGSAYLGAMRAAGNFAFANRQILAHFARSAFEETFARRTNQFQLLQVYDVAHNMGKVEHHEICGQTLSVCVHRKGATRAFGPSSPELGIRHRTTGQPVLVPGSMGTASWVLAGTDESMQRSLGSTCHGAGRVWSRARAKKEIRGDELRRQLEARGVAVRAGSASGLAEEAPSAYKDVDEVVETVVAAGIAIKVAKLRPVAVIKG